MNLNLKPIELSGLTIKYLYILLLLSIGYTQSLLGQNKTMLNGGLSISPGMGSAFINNDNFNRYKDSVHSDIATRFLEGFHLWINYSIKKELDFQIGIGYQNQGFARKQNNLKFDNLTYPGLGAGKIEDHTNSTKGITYNYIFQYVQIPALFNFYLQRSGDFKWTYNFTAGIATNILVNHQIRADLTNFTINSIKTFKLDSTGFDARRVSVTLIAGAKFEYKVDKTKSYFIQPIICFDPISVSSNIQANLWYLAINLGVLYPISK